MIAYCRFIIKGSKKVPGPNLLFDTEMIVFYRTFVTNKTSFANALINKM